MNNFLFTLIITRTIKKKKEKKKKAFWFEVENIFPNLVVCTTTIITTTKNKSRNQKWCMNLDQSAPQKRALLRTQLVWVSCP